MNIRDARQEIIHTIRAYTSKNEDGSYRIPLLRQRPLLLIGPPGIGKTAVMEQAASACGVGFVSYTMTHHTRQSAMGLPFIEHQNFNGKEYAVTEYTMSEIIASVYRCMEETGCQEGLLFLDEINCVSETLAPAMLQFLQTKMFGSHRLPDGWVLAAAGNPPEYNKSVREFDIATLDRLKYIPIEADYDAWRTYALEMNIHGAILSYLDTRPEQFYLLRQTYSSKGFVTARGWEDLSCLLLEYENLGLPVTADLIAQYLRCEELVQDFSGFYSLYASRRKSLPVTALMKGDPDACVHCRSWITEAPFSERLYLVHLMLSHLGTKLQSWNKACESQKLFTDLLERLERFRSQQKLSSAADAIPSFLEKERNILQIRQEHGISTESELQKSRQSLALLQELGYRMKAESDCQNQSLNSEPDCQNQSLNSEPDCQRKLLQDLQSEADRQAYQLSKLFHNSIQFLEETADAEYAFFLSSLLQNTLAARFLQKHMPELYEKVNAQLDFASREEALRQ